MKLLVKILLANLFLISWGCGPASRGGVQNPPSPPKTPSSSPTGVVPSSSGSPVIEGNGSIPTEDYGVYSALLSYLIYSEHFGGEPEDLIVINDHTVSHAKPDKLQSEEIVEKETLDDYALKNEQSYQLKDYFDIYLKYVFVTQEEMIPPDSKEFGIKYPKAKSIISISRFGFNRDRAQAIAYVAYSCGTNCGEGAFWLMSKTNGVWHFHRMDNTSIERS